MKPSKKIFVGSSLVLAALLLQAVSAFVAQRLIGNISEVVEGADKIERTATALDGAHRQSMILFSCFGIAWLLLAAGAILFVIGVYQNCKVTEELLLSSRRNGK